MPRPSTAVRVVALAAILVCRPTLAQCSEVIEIRPDELVDFDNFGQSVGIDGDHALIGAPGDSEQGDDAGAVYAYERIAGAWTLQEKIFSPSPSNGDDFGVATAVSGQWAAVGAPDVNVNEGRVYLLFRNGFGWQQTATLNDPIVGANAHLGTALTFGGATVDVLVAGQVGPGVPGAATVYRRTSFVTWSHEQRLVASDGVDGDAFGLAVAVDGDVIVCGAPGDDANSGAVYVFRWDGAAWNEEFKLTAPISRPLASFGASVTIDGTQILVGAPGDTGVDPPIEGRVHVFEEGPGGWTHVAELSAIDQRPGFGSRLALEDDALLVNDRLFRWNGSEWLEAHDFRMRVEGPTGLAFSGRLRGLDGGTGIWTRDRWEGGPLNAGTAEFITNVTSLATARPSGIPFYSSIQGALDDPAVCRIDLTAGTHVASLRLPPRAVTMRSVDGIGAATLDGGGIRRCFRADAAAAGVMVEGLVIRNGFSGRDGGGLLCENGATPEFRLCVFEDNTAGGDGGAVAVRSGAAPVFTGCLFTGNTAGSDGGAVHVENADATLVNVTVTDNDGRTSGGLFAEGGSLVTLRNTIAWNNAGPELGGAGSYDVAYSLVEGGAAGPGNTDGDPMFADAPAGNYRLDFESVAIDAGDVSALPATVAVDLDEFPRRTDDPGKPDSGAGTAPIVDMGAFEFQESSSCAGRKLIASGGSSSFGGQLSLDDDVLVSGAGGGVIYVYRRSGDAWWEEQIIDLGDNPDALAITGETIFAGFQTDGADGQVRTFDWNGVVWTEGTTLEASPSGGDIYWFGRSIDVGDGVAIIGAGFVATGDSGSGQGAAYVFRRESGVWTQETQLTSPAPGQTLLGTKVSIDGDVAVSLAQVQSGPGPIFPAVAQVFRRTDGTWAYEAELPLPTTLIAYPISVSGDRILAGGGMTSVWVWDGAAWSEEAVLPSLPELGVIYEPLRIEGDRLIAGTRFLDTVGADAGAAYVFRREGTTWIEDRRLLACDAGAGDLFGTVTLSGDTAVIGAVGQDFLGENRGAAYVFDNLSCAADLVEPIGMVDTEDLLAVINDWNCTTPPDVCPGDIAPPWGVVDVEDLLKVVNAWGECPTP